MTTTETSMAPAITFEWVVEGADLLPKDQATGNTDVVKVIRWRCNASDGTNTATSYGQVDIPPPAEGEPFIPYSSLTKEEVVQWVQLALGVDGLATLTERLVAELTAPEIITKPLPW